MNVFARIRRKLAALAEQSRRKRVLRELLEKSREPLRRVGTSYGGWVVPESSLLAGKTAVCVGAGEDISFDVALNRMGLRVFTVDPTPRAAAHVRQVLAAAASGVPVSIDNSPTEHYDLQGFDAGRFTFLELGLSDKNSTLRFWAPKNAKHVSHSLVNLQHTDKFFEARCVRLQDLCADQGIEAIEILKLDVEGAEYAVLADLLAGQLRPRVVCIEFDEGCNPQDGGYLQRIADAAGQMKQGGYRLVHIDSWNFTFVLGALGGA